MTSAIASSSSPPATLPILPKKKPSHKQAFARWALFSPTSTTRALPTKASSDNYTGSPEDFKSFKAFVRTYKDQLKSMSFHADMTSEEIFSFVSKCKNLEDLDLSKCLHLTGEDLAKILTNCGPHLQSFTFPTRGNSIRDSFPTLRHCSSLKKLILPQRYEEELNIKEDPLIPHLKHLVHLEEITLPNFGSYRLPGYAAEELAKHCKNLKKIDSPSKSFFISLAPILKDSIAASEYFINHFPLLEYFPAELPNDALIEKMVRDLPNLKEVKLIASFEVSSKGLTALAKETKNLKTLQLDSIPDSAITAEAIVLFARNSPDLESLSLTKVKDLSEAKLIAMLDAFPKLKEIDLSNCTGITGEAIKAIGTHCKNIRSITLKYLKIPAKPIRDLIKLCPNLERIDLFQQENAAVVSIARHCPKLRYLHLRGCDEITDKSIQEIAKHCHELREFTYIGRSIYKFKTLRKILKKNPQLESIHWETHGNVDITHADPFLEKMKKLRSIRGSDSSSLDKLVKRLRPLCKRLFESY